MIGKPASFFASFLREAPTCLSVISYNSMKPRLTTLRLFSTTEAPLPPNFDFNWASRWKTWMSLSTMNFCAQVGKFDQVSSPRLDWMMKVPPFLRPESGFEWPKTLGSGESTTSTKTYSQLMRMGSGAADR